MQSYYYFSNVNKQNFQRKQSIVITCLFTDNNCSNCDNDKNVIYITNNGGGEQKKVLLLMNLQRNGTFVS